MKAILAWVLEEEYASGEKLPELLLELEDGLDEQIISMVEHPVAAFEAYVETFISWSEHYDVREITW